MYVDVYVIAFNEEFLLPHFIKHYRGLFTDCNITVFDNQSTDGTKQIALDNNCKIISFDTGGKIKDDNYLFIKNNCWKRSKADWVIVSDVDEFLDLRIELDNKKFTIVNTHGYDIVGGVESKLGVYNPIYCKHICFSPKHIKEIRYSIGCHSCEPIGNIIGSSPVNLMHRKYISEDYVYKRHLMYQERLSDLNKKYGWGIEYQNVTEQSVKEKFEELRKNAKLVL